MRQARVKPAGGFTLIELLVAISVMSLLAILSWQGLDGMARGQALNRERGDAVLTLQTGLAQWGADLDAIAPLSQIRPIDWDGRVLRITRRSSDSRTPAVYVVAWTLRTGSNGTAWQRWQSPPATSRPEWQQAWDLAASWAQDASAGGGGAAVSLMPVDGWQLQYFRNDAWSPAVAGAALDVSSPVPDGIRLLISLPPGSALSGVIVRDWVRPAATVPKT